MKLPPIEYVEPDSLEAACALLKAEDERGRIIAGGTDVLVDLKAGLLKCRRLIFWRMSALGH